MKASGFVLVANFHLCLILLNQSLESGCVRRTAVRRSKKAEGDLVVSEILELSIKDANAGILNEGAQQVYRIGRLDFSLDFAG